MTDPKWDSKTAIYWARILAGTTVGFTLLALLLIWLSETAKPTHKVAWESAKAKLNDDDVPSTDFWHDAENDLLIHRGKISRDRRDQLLKLNFDTRAKDEEPSYRRSIDELTFKSNEERSSLGFLLFITVLGGVIGVQARSILYFIMHACVKNDLNLKRWWPWYYLRPFLGMIFGPLVVLLIMTGLLPAPDAPSLNKLTMFGLSVLVGLVASMFFDKLVQLAQTLFGLDSDDTPPQPQPSDSPASGSTPDELEASGRWDDGPEEAVITWTQSAAPNLDHYEVRMTPGADYDAANHTVVGTVQPGSTLEVRTVEGLASSGDEASFRVFAILTTTEESGSDTVTITRP